MRLFTTKSGSVGKDMAAEKEFDHVETTHGSDTVPETVIEAQENSIHAKVLIPHPSRDPNDPLVSLF